MISKETAMQIYHCHREISVAEQLLIDVQKVISERKCDPHAPLIKDCFGRSADLQLGVPSGDNAHRLFYLSYELAEPIIKAHIANKKAELEQWSQAALVEANINE